MRKKEYIHLHALLVEVSRYMIENEAMPAETLSTYHELGTRPSSIHRPKGKHHEAITVLYSDIELWFDDTQTEPPEVR